MHAEERFAERATQYNDRKANSPCSHERRSRHYTGSSASRPRIRSASLAATVLRRGGEHDRCSHREGTGTFTTGCAAASAGEPRSPARGVGSDPCREGRTRPLQEHSAPLLLHRRTEQHERAGAVGAGTRREGRTDTAGAIRRGRGPSRAWNEETRPRAADTSARGPPRGGGVTRWCCPIREWRWTKRPARSPRAAARAPRAKAGGAPARGATHSPGPRARRQRWGRWRRCLSPRCSISTPSATWA